MSDPHPTAPAGEWVTDPVHGTSYLFVPQGDDLIVHSIMRPGGKLPKHLHPRQDEYWWSERGTARVFVDGAWREVTPADGRVHVRPNVVHALENRSGETIYLSTEVTPALGLQGFLTESAEAARQGLFRRGGIPSGLAGARWSTDFLDRYGDDVVMTFPPPAVQRLIRRFGPRPKATAATRRPS